MLFLYTVYIYIYIYIYIYYIAILFFIVISQWLACTIKATPYPPLFTLSGVCQEPAFKKWCTCNTCTVCLLIKIKIIRPVYIYCRYLELKARFFSHLHFRVSFTWNFKSCFFVFQGWLNLYTCTSCMYTQHTMFINYH